MSRLLLSLRQIEHGSNIRIGTPLLPTVLRQRGEQVGGAQLLLLLGCRRSLHNTNNNNNKDSSSPPLSNTPKPAPTQRPYIPPTYHANPSSKEDKVKFWPFFLLIGLGSLSYYMLARKRHAAAQQSVNQRPALHSSPTFPVAPLASSSPSSPSPSSSSTTTNMTSSSSTSSEPAAAAFNPSDVTVIFVLGGPGAGKGTQSSRLVSTYGFTHLSAGDLLRAEQHRPGSQFGELISDCIRDGAIVPMEVTVKLLENAMRDALLVKKKKKKETSSSSNPSPNPNPNTDAHATTTAAGGGDNGGGEEGDVDVSGIKGKFLIDGFPRKMDQAIRFETSVCRARFVLFYDCPEHELERRLLERGKTSGREDDNPDSIRKRFRTFVQTSMPVVDHYEKQSRVVRVMAVSSVDSVFEETQKQLVVRMGADL